MNTFWNKRILITVLSFWITVLSSRPITKYELKNETKKHPTDQFLDLNLLFSLVVLARNRYVTKNKPVFI